jgi:limonene 1,2-monooxygenase
MGEAQRPQNFGFFSAPLHDIPVSPALQFERDIQLIEWAEELGFQEAFVGEHHSVGHETIGCPEMFLTAAAQRTKAIKLGIGVISVPYHHPFHVAERAVFLDQMTRGRAVVGFGPGSLTSDARMLGIDVADSRNRMREALDAIVRLIEGEVVTEQTDWYTLNEARLQLNSYTRPRLEMITASVASPTGPRAAGKYGMGMINFAAHNPDAFAALNGHWAIAEEEAALSGRTISRDSWRLSAIVHLAESEDEARQHLKEGGFLDTVTYLGKVSILPAIEGDTYDELIDNAIANNIIKIGTPDDAIELIDALADQTGGFGSFLVTLIDVVPPAAQKRSLELFAEVVIPHFRDQLQRRHDSKTWAVDTLGGGRKDWEDAIVAATEQYEAEKKATAAS